MLRLLVILLILSPVQVFACTNPPVTLTGELKSGQSYNQRFADNLYFRLIPNDEGWKMEIGPENMSARMDYIYPVNEPIRGKTLQDIDGSYAEVPDFPFDVKFSFLVDEKSFAIADDAMDHILWPKTDAEQEENFDRIDNLRTGAATLHVDGKAIHDPNDKDDKNMIIQWIKFRVDLTVPTGQESCGPKG
jgi:hypothetical protein